MYSFFTYMYYLTCTCTYRLFQEARDQLRDISHNLLGLHHLTRSAPQLAATDNTGGSDQEQNEYIKKTTSAVEMNNNNKGVYCTNSDIYMYITTCSIGTSR